MGPTPNGIPATLIPGDGIGPEIVEATVRILDALGAPFTWEEHQAGLASLQDSAAGDLLPAATLESIGRTRLALKGPLTTPVAGGFKSINVRLRKAFTLYANVRPARSYMTGGPFDDIDLVLVRENLEGLYVGVEHYIPVADDPHAIAEASGIMTRHGCRRVAAYAFDYAVRTGRRKVTVVHKANRLRALTGLFLETAMEVAQAYRDRLEIDSLIVDRCAMQLVMAPHEFDVLLTSNMFGDILSDEIAGLVGGLGLAPGANIGENAAIFEAVHGSAPDIAGQGIANPTALLLAATMMLDHVGKHEPAHHLRNTLARMLREGIAKTRDLGGTATTREFTGAVIANL
jgi:isocitrate dehydrogenase (NAD+)